MRVTARLDDGSPAQRRCFNMIEVVLAIGVVAIGVVSIMALFPVGVSASRDSMAQTYAAESADQFLHHLEYLIRQNWNGYVNSADSTIPLTMPSSDAFAGTPMANTNGTMFVHDTEAGRYRVLRYVDVSESNSYAPNDDILDFEGILRVWRSQVEIPGTGSPLELAYEVAVALNLEISWPAPLPYAARQKSLYRLELFKR